MKNHKIGLIIFLFLSVGITLYPPFRWDTIKFNDEYERLKFLHYYNINTGDLPFKSYDFLFSNYKKISWGWDSINEKSILVNMPLERKIIFGELILEYLLAGFIAFFVQIIIMFAKRKGDK